MLVADAPVSGASVSSGESEGFESVITTFVFNVGMAGLTSGGSVTWGTGSGGDTIKARLVEAAVTPGVNATSMTGLTAVGTDATLSGKSKSTDTSTNQVAYDATDPVYTSLTGNDVGSLVIYKFDTDDAGSTPLACLALPVFTPDGTTQTVVFASTGAFYTQQ
jgi:hypothetical protein